MKIHTFKGTVLNKKPYSKLLLKKEQLIPKFLVRSEIRKKQDTLLEYIFS